MAKTKSVKNDVQSVVDRYAYDYGMLMVNEFAGLLGEWENPLKPILGTGNLKIPKTTAIFNMSSAKDCVSLDKGLCKACVVNELKELINVCYARKAEVQYPAVLPYRDRQEKYWLDVSAEEFALHFLRINANKRIKFDKMRFNEAGDFHDQEGLDKADKVAKLLLKYGVTVYCYTSRDDLDFTKVKHLVVNRSLNGLKEFEPVEGLTNEFLMITKEEGEDFKKWPKGYAKCPADCRICDRCSVKGKKSFVIQH
jgi:hypothetical protein